MLQGSKAKPGAKAKAKAKADVAEIDASIAQSAYTDAAVACDAHSKECQDAVDGAEVNRARLQGALDTINADKKSCSSEDEADAAALQLDGSPSAGLSHPPEAAAFPPTSGSSADVVTGKMAAMAPPKRILPKPNVPIMVTGDITLEFGAPTNFKQMVGQTIGDDGKMVWLDVVFQIAFGALTLIERERIDWKLVDRIILLSGACGLASVKTVSVKGEWPMGI